MKVLLFAAYYVALTFALKVGLLEPSMFLVILGVGLLIVAGPVRLFRFIVGLLMMARGLG